LTYVPESEKIISHTCVRTVFKKHRPLSKSERTVIVRKARCYCQVTEMTRPPRMRLFDVRTTCVSGWYGFNWNLTVDKRQRRR